MMIDSEIRSGNMRVGIGIPAALDFLEAYGLTTDKNGFIVSSESMNIVEPVAYNAEIFADAPQPNEYSLAEYFSPHSKIASATTEKVHLTNLYTVIDTEEGPRPVHDYTILIELMHRETGRIFNTITMWSDDVNEDKIRDDIETVTVDEGEKKKPKLACLSCNYYEVIGEWDGNDRNPVCSECSTPWNIDMLYRCEMCKTKHYDMETSNNVFNSMTCDVCEENNSDFKTKTRYDDW